VPGASFINKKSRKQKKSSAYLESLSSPDKTNKISPEMLNNLEPISESDGSILSESELDDILLKS
jgi:hypothetical protein